ncbi:MAG: hypothetical protein ACTSPY_18155 [Candidatus Helarchaeota archaeon]
MNDFIFKWENRNIKVKILEDLPEIRLFTTMIGPFKKGDKVNMMYWMAKLLNKYNMVEILEQMEYDLGDIKKIEGIEQGRVDVQKIDKDFYVKIKETLLNLYNELKDSNNFSLNARKLQIKDEMQSLFRDIFSRRLYKILRIASKDRNPQSIINNFTNEEILLFNQLQKTIKAWMKEFIEFDKINTP